MKNAQVALLDADNLPVAWTQTRVFVREQHANGGAGRDSILLKPRVGLANSAHRQHQHQLDLDEENEPLTAPSLASPASASSPLSTPVRNGGSSGGKDASSSASPLSSQFEPIREAPVAAESEVPASAASSSSALSSSSAISDISPSPFCTLTGTWKVDSAKSDTLEGMLTALSVPWLARKVILALNVTTTIIHDPQNHVCTVTDTSSAGEQATVHRTTGDWTETKTKEGKLIRMCAKEGEEMRAVWPDLPAAMRDAALAFPASDVPFDFPKHLPLPVSPALKQHPLPYGYLWINSLLPDIAGGEMQDVRVLLDRTVLMQQSHILKHQKVVSTTTRYFNRVETEDERARAEAEWEQKCSDFVVRSFPPEASPSSSSRRAAAGSTASTLTTEGGDESGYASESSRSDSASLSRTSSRASLSSLPLSLSPGPFLGAGGSFSGPGPHPNLSGSWSVIKERSNDLGVLLKRMGVPWIYRAFASTLEIRTTIVHSLVDLTLTDKSKFGSHSQTLRTDGMWFTVGQYGNKSRLGLCRVTLDPSKASVTVETTYYPSKGDASQGKNLVRNGSVSSASSSSSAAAAAALAAAAAADEGALMPATPSSTNTSLLTVESGGSNPPSAAPSPSQPRPRAQAGRAHEHSSDDSLSLLSRELRIDHDPDEPRGASVEEHSPHAGLRKASDGTIESVKERARANSDPVAAAAAEAIAAAQQRAAAANSSAQGDTDTPLDISSHDPLSWPSQRQGVRGSSQQVLVPASGSSTPLTAASPSPRPSVPGSPALLSSSPSFSSTSPTGPGVPSGLPSHTSRLVAIRVLLGPDLLRQVITYLEGEVVVCVCSRFYRRDLTRAERAARDAAAKDADRERKDEEERRRKQEQTQQREQQEQQRAREVQNRRASSSVGGAGGNGRQAAASSPAAASSSSRPAAASAAPAAAPSGASSASAPAVNKPSWRSLPMLTAPRALLLLLFMACVICSSWLLALTVLTFAAGAEIRGIWQPTPFSPSSKASPASVAQRSSASRERERPPTTIPVAPGVSVTVVPLRRNNST